MADALQAPPEAEIAAFDPAGELVVVLETTDDAGIAAAAKAMDALPGLRNVSLVFRHVDPEAADPPTRPG